MASNSDKGHAKNVANFENLIEFCTRYDQAYNPSREELKLTNLQTLLAEARIEISSCSQQKISNDNATDARAQVFAGLKSLGTRIVNALAASGVDINVIENARSINRKLQGIRASRKKANDNTSKDGDVVPAKTISSSQQSADNQIEHFRTLVNLVASHQLFQPNEPELKLTALEATLQRLTVANSAVIGTYSLWSTARLKRDHLLYNDNNGLTVIAQAVKTYVKSIFGATSPEFRQISSIEFKKVEY